MFLEKDIACLSQFLSLFFCNLKWRNYEKTQSNESPPSVVTIEREKTSLTSPYEKYFSKNIFCPKFWKSKSRVVEIFWICWTLLLHFFEYSKIGNAPKSSPEKSQFSQPFNIFLRKWRHTWTPIEWSSVTNLLGFVKLTRE